MNQTIKMWEESNERMSSLMMALRNPKIKPDLDIVQLAQREMENQIKLINSHVAIFQVESKNRRARRSLENMNLIDNSTAISIANNDNENDMVMCHDTGKLIRRHECLSYSGSHTEDCAGCDVGIETRSILIDKQQNID